MWELSPAEVPYLQPNLMNMAQSNECQQPQAPHIPAGEQGGTCLQERRCLGCSQLMMSYKHFPYRQEKLLYVSVLVPKNLYFP